MLSVVLALCPGGMEERMAGRASGELFWFGREVQMGNLTCLMEEPNSGLLPHRLQHCFLTLCHGGINMPKAKHLRSLQVSCREL